MGDTRKYEEWFFQSDYDIETAGDMFKMGRYIYCIFMCHLSLEKALKGLSIKRTGEFPPKSHSLIYFVEKIGLQISDSRYEFLFTLNKISIPTRYPEDLQKLFDTYTKEKTEDILKRAKETQVWIKQQ
jgi:HEPN domain-containing protein